MVLYTLFHALSKRPSQRMIHRSFSLVRTLEGTGGRCQFREEEARQQVGETRDPSHI